VFLGVVEQDFERLDFVPFMSLCVAEIADDTLMAACRFETDEVE